MAGTFATKAGLKIFHGPLSISMKATSYKVILFDLFHTLVDVGTALESCGRYTADILGVSREAWNRAWATLSLEWSVSIRTSSLFFTLRQVSIATFAPSTVPIVPIHDCQETL